MKPGTIELLGLCFVDPMSTKLASNKTSIHRIARHGGVIKGMSLKTVQWSSKCQANRALKLSLHHTTELAARLVGKRKTSLQCNNQHKHRLEQRWHTKLMGSLLKKDMGGSNEEDGLFTFSSLRAQAPKVTEDTQACTSCMQDDTDALLSSCAPEDTTVLSKRFSDATENMQACTSQV